MAYCTVEQVESEFKDVTFSASTSVTDTDVTRFIEEADAAIDAVLGARFEVPVTGNSNSLIVLRTISIQLVTLRIKAILQVKTGEQKVDQNTQGMSMSQLAIKHPMLQALAAGKVPLDGATLASSADGVRSYAVDEGLEYTFQRNTDQW